MLVGTSLKMYFTHARTVEWTRTVAAGLRERSLDGVEPFVIPQFPSIPACLEAARHSGLEVGAQDVATHDAGAFTGEVSAAVLAEIGCRYVEVGHAERRALFGETDDIVAAKADAALRHGLTPIVCVGEPDRGDPARAIDHCLDQIRAALCAADAADRGGEIVIAYEPAWAIGAPEPAGVDHIRAVCSALRDAPPARPRRRRVIYGGSARPGLLPRIADAVDGIFLGRNAHEPSAFGAVLDDAASLG